MNIPEEEDVEVARGCHAEDESGPEETDERYAVRDFGHSGLERADGGRSDLFAGESVNGYGDDGVDGCCDAFLDGDGAREVARWVLHFC